MSHSTAGEAYIVMPIYCINQGRRRRKDVRGKGGNMAAGEGRMSRSTGGRGETYIVTPI